MSNSALSAAGTATPTATPAGIAAAAVGALAYIVLVPILLGDHPYFLNVLTNASVLSFASLGVWVTFSIGRVNIAQGAFAMIGGYIIVLSMNRLGVPFVSTLPALHAAGAAALLRTDLEPPERLRAVAEHHRTDHDHDRRHQRRVVLLHPVFEPAHRVVEPITGDRVRQGRNRHR